MAMVRTDYWVRQLADLSATGTTKDATPAEAAKHDQVKASAVEKLVMAFVRIRGLDRLDDALMTRAWLAADMGIGADELDSLLRLLRWQGMVSLPDDHLVVVENPAAMVEIALGSPAVMELVAPRH